MATEIRYINNAGGGFNGRKTVEDGTTIERFFAQQMPGEDRGRYNIRVNNAVPVEGQVLRGGDLVSIIPGKYDGGAFGAEFMKNLQAAAEVGRLARNMPNLSEDLKAINELGAAVKATPNLAENLTALVGFVSAVKVLDQPDPAPSVSDSGLDLTALPGGHLQARNPEFDALAANSKNFVQLSAEMAEFGGWEAIKDRLSKTTVSHGTDVAVAAAPVAVRAKDIETTPPAPGCVRLVTGMGIGRAEPIEAGETMEHFFNRVKPGRSPQSYRIELNGSTADPDQVLVEGDSVLIRDIDAVKGKLAGGSSCM